MDERTLEQLTDELSAQISMMGGVPPSDEDYKLVVDSVAKLYDQKTKVESVICENEQRSKKEEHDYEIERLKLEAEKEKQASLNEIERLKIEAERDRQASLNEIERLKLEAERERQKNDHLDITLKHGSAIMLGLLTTGVTIWGALRSWAHEEVHIYDKAVEKAFIGRLFRK